MGWYQKRPLREGEIYCQSHKVRLGYIACLHVRDGARIVGFQPAKRDETGTALCAACDARARDLKMDDLITVCEQCLGVKQ